MSQTDTTTDNKDNVETIKSLAELATEERLKAGWGPIGRTGPGRDPSLSDAERALAERKDRQKYAVTSAVRSMINNIVEQAERPIRVLALPGTLAFDEVLGSSVAMRILLDAGNANEVHVHDFTVALRDRTRVPSVQSLVQLFNGRSYVKSNATLGEAFWLCEVAQWFQCLTSTFGNVLANNVMIAGKEVIQPEDIDFGRKLTHEGNDAILRDAMDQQYSVLEALLHRI
jgi:hypothetical protein